MYGDISANLRRGCHLPGEFVNCEETSSPRFVIRTEQKDPLCRRLSPTVHDGLRLRDTKLPPNLIGTLLNARAESG
jgi:hypothetical protein